MHTVHAIGDSTGSVLGLARCGAPPGVIVQTVQNSVEILQSSDKVDTPVVVASDADGQTAQKTRGDSTGAVPGQVVHARRPHDRCPGLLGRVCGQGCCHARCCLCALRVQTRRTL